MAIYTIANEEILGYIKPYINSGERARVSEPVEYNGKLYREVRFSKKFMEKFRSNITGYLYIDENYNVVNQKTLQEKLAKLCYYSEVFFDDENKASIVNAFLDEGAIEKDKKDYEEAENGLIYLAKEGIEEAEQVKGIISKLPRLRVQNNLIIKELIDKKKELESNNQYFSLELLDEYLPKYKRALELNFEKIKLIDSGRMYYNELKKKTEKQKKKLGVRFNTKVTFPLMRVVYILTYFIKLLTSCQGILHMNTSQYVKSLSTIEKENIDFRLQLVRS